MSFLSLLLLALQLPVVAPLPLLPQALIPASVEGVVIDSETRQPLAGATVTVQQRSGEAGKMIIVTGNDGRFAFRSMMPGLYSIEAGRAGYATETAGGPAVDPRTAALSLVNLAGVPVVQELKSGQAISGLQFLLSRGGVISGRITTDRGEVVVGAIVQAFRTTHRDGMRERMLVQSAVSNDLGEYRLFQLKPGQYHVSLTPPVVTTPNAPSQGFSIPLFFPGTIDMKASTPIDLRPGEAVEGVDFSSIPTRTRRITGGVQGNGSMGVSVVLSPANGAARKTATILGDSANPNFQFTDIVPGPYMLAAQNIDGRAFVPIDVRNADVLGTRIILGQGYRIPSIARIEGGPQGDDRRLESVYLNIRPDVPVLGIDTLVYTPFPDGHFILDVLPVDYWIDIDKRQAPDYYIKSITLDGVDVLNQGLRATSSATGTLQMVVDTRFGAVQGSTGRGNVTVVLAPDAPRRNHRPLYQSIKTGNGAFAFDKVPPGDYKLFAWPEDTIDNGGPWLDPEYLRRYEDRATPVRIQVDMKTIVERTITVF